MNAATLSILVTANTASANAALARTQAQLNSTAASGTRAGASMSAFDKRAGMVAKGGLLAAAYGLYKATQVGMKFQQQMSDLEAVTGASGTQMERFKRQALEMGKATTFSATEVADAQTELAKGGLRNKDILGGGLKAALDLAAAGQLDLATAASTTVNAMKLFGISGRGATKVSDMLATAANTTTADVEDFARALTQGGSAAKQAGLPLNDTITILEALAEAGIKNSDAGTSMKTALLQLLAPTQRQAALARELGLEFTNQQGEIKGVVGLAKELQDGLAGMTKAQRVATLKTLAGTDGFRTLAAILDLGTKRAKEFKDANREVGTAADTAAKKTDNLAGDIERLKGSLETESIKLFDQLEPVLRWTVTATVDSIEFGSDMNWSEFDMKVSGAINDALSAAGGLASSGFTSVWEDFKRQADEAGRKVRDFFGKPFAINLDFTTADIAGKVRDALNKAKGIAKGGVDLALGIGGDVVGKARNAYNRVKGIVRGGISIALSIPSSIINEARRTFAKIKGIFSGDPGEIRPHVDSSVVAAARRIQNQIAAQFATPVTQRVEVVYEKKVAPFASGGHNLKEQVGLVGEKGRELMRTADGGWTMLGQKGPHLTAIPQGADIYTASETRKLLAMGIPGFAKGKKSKLTKAERKERARMRTEAARASKLLNLESILAAAELTPGTADDLAAINALLGYWGGVAKANKNAVSLKDPLKRQKGLEKLLEARQQIKSYTDQIADLTAVDGGSTTPAGLTAEQLKELTYLSSLGVKFNPSQYAGMFASGGSIPAGRWGIAGEAGPEVVQGPASVTPMGAGAPAIYEIYIGGEKIDERVDVRIRRQGRESAQAHAAGVRK